MTNLPPIKICIHSGKKPLAEKDGIPISKAKSLQTLSNAYPQHDFEGIILPCARSNPELPQILQIIHDHKENLYARGYEKLGVNQLPIHQEFVKIIQQHFPKLFW